MKVKSIPSRWIYEEGLRLDSGPYMSGAIEARKILEDLSTPKEPLQNVTSGGMQGIFHAGRIKRLWVDSPKYGYPFLSGTDILQPDLSQLKIISKLSVKENPQLIIHQDWTLITRSGSIGRMAYARPEMDGMACTEDVLRVVPDKTLIPPGYLYAYLCSKFGVPIVISGTYGAIIQHIEPHHIANLPVPRLDAVSEEKIHSLIDESANKRDSANEALKKSRENIIRELGLPEPQDKGTSTSFLTFETSSSHLLRLDACHFSPNCVFAEKNLSQTDFSTQEIGSVAKVFTPGIFKRQHVDNPEFGYEYFSGSELFQVDPKPRGHLSKTAPNINNYLVEKNWLLIQDAGQLGGLIGRVTRVNVSVDMGVVSNHLMRIKPQSDIDSGYLFALLSSWYGYRAITRHAFGTSIPQLDPKHIANIEIPWPDKEIRKKIANPVLKAWQLQDRAIEAEKEAIALVEKAIEEAV